MYVYTFYDIYNIVMNWNIIVIKKIFLKMLETKKTNVGDNYPGE